MYRSAVTGVFLAAAAIAALDLVPRLLFRRERTAGETPSGSPLLAWLRIAVNAVGFVSLIVAVYTSLLTGSGQLTGDRLITHVSTAPAFAVSAVAIALFWAHRNRFSEADWMRLRSPGLWAIPLRKFFFWIAIVLAIPTLTSILAAMLPFFGTEDQENVIRVHRYCAPLMAAAGLLFAYFALVSWRERSKD